MEEDEAGDDVWELHGENEEGKVKGGEGQGEHYGFWCQCFGKKCHIEIDLATGKSTSDDIKHTDCYIPQILINQPKIS